MLQFLKKKVRNKKGFTLVELIVVITILGILAGIAVPRFTSVTADAQATADRATARTILSAITMAEASLQVSGYPSGETEQTKFVGEVNKSLNDPIKYGNTGTGWTIYYDAGKWSVYKDGAPIS